MKIKCHVNLVIFIKNNLTVNIKILLKCEMQIVHLLFFYDVWEFLSTQQFRMKDRFECTRSFELFHETKIIHEKMTKKTLDHGLVSNPENRPLSTSSLKAKKVMTRAWELLLKGCRSMINKNCCVRRVKIHSFILDKFKLTSM